MCQFVETIRVKNKKFYELSYHQKRFDKTRRDFFQIFKSDYKLCDIKFPQYMDKGLYKCRIVYCEKIDKIEFIKYTKPKIQSLKLVYCDDIDYSYKYTNRKKLEELRKNKGIYDDILIVKNKQITDTSFSNVVFFDGNQYVTPKNPLLKGTMREKLLDEKKIIERILRVKDIDSFKMVFLINSLVDLEDNVCLNVKNIYGNHIK